LSGHCAPSRATPAAGQPEKLTVASNGRYRPMPLKNSMFERCFQAPIERYSSYF
jgi:hypothetical protein